MIAIAVVAIVIVTRTEAPKPAPSSVVARTDKGSAAVTFEPIDDKPAVVPPDAAVQEAASIDAAIEMPVDTSPVDAQHKRDKKPRGDKGEKVEKKEPEVVVATTQLTLAEIGKKFQSTSRLYETYKQSNGMRLDAEWNDLTQFLQNKAQKPEHFEEAARRIDAFRAKLRD